MALTTRTNQQAYCKAINKDIDKESKYLFTYTHTNTQRDRNTAFKWHSWLMMVVSSDRAC